LESDDSALFAQARKLGLETVPKLRDLPQQFCAFIGEPDSNWGDFLSARHAIRAVDFRQNQIDGPAEGHASNMNG
jgi:hypothetical protein